MRETRQSGSEGGEAPSGAFPTLIHIRSARDCLPDGSLKCSLGNDAA